MSDFENWLKKLEIDLKSEIKDSRSFDSYIDEIICNTKNFYIWKIGQNEIIKEGNTTTIISGPFKPEIVKPNSIRLRLNNYWRSRFKDKVIISLGHICRTVVSWEERSITETLTRNVKVFDVKSEFMRRDDLHDPIDHLISLGNYADTLLVSPLQLSKLRHEKEFTPKWNLSSQFVETKGKRFIGLMGELSVYETTSLTEKEGVLYEKRKIKVRKTPLTVKFDNYEDPRILHISEDIFAWSEEDGAIAKVIFKKV